MNNNLPLRIVSYTSDKTLLSDKTEINGNFVLSSDNKITTISKEIAAQDFFNNPSLIVDQILPHLYNKELLLVGCGNNFIIPSFEVKKQIHSLNLKLEWMTTTSAVHTYNLLMEDFRSCVAIFYN